MVERETQVRLVTTVLDLMLATYGVARDGLPGEWVNPFTGWAPGIEVAVKRAGAV